MEFLIKNRATGKTTGLIYTSEATGYPIVVPNQNQVDYIKQMAQEIGCNIPEPFCVNELINGSNSIRSIIRPAHVLIDEVYPILADALKNYLGVEVVCATMTDPKRELKVKD